MKQAVRSQKNTMEISEIFESIQGEGKYAGMPALFIRTVGCNRRCWFCDTKYSWKQGKDYTIKQLVRIIRKSKLHWVVFTGGEPLLQLDAILQIIAECQNKLFALETNGDLITRDNTMLLFRYFAYVACSPKSLDVAQRVSKLFQGLNFYDIKVVTDLVENKEMIPYATLLMPLTYYDKRDKIVMKKVWKYCVEHEIRYSPRLQFFIFGKKRKV